MNTKRIRTYKREVEELEENLLPSFRYLIAEEWRGWPRLTTKSIAYDEQDSEFRTWKFRERFARKRDIEAIFECLATVGELALSEPWVIQSIRWWRALLAEKVRFQWPPEIIHDFTPQDPKEFKKRGGEEQDDGSVIIPHPKNRKPKKGAGLFRGAGFRAFYRWHPIPRGEYKQRRDEAKEYLERVGQSLAFIGSGRKKKLTLKEIKEKTKASKRDYVNDKRALQYCDEAWQQYEAKKEALIRRGIINKTFLEKAVEEIEKAEFSRDGEAKSMAHQRFIKKVNRDKETLLSKKILR